MKAMILAAGLGTRLKPLTEDIAKPMVPIVNKPVMEHIVELLVGHGIRDIFVNLHYYPHAIRNHFGDGKAWGAHIKYSYEEELLGTAGGVKKLEKDLHGDTFLIISGDALTDINLGALIEYHKSKGGIASIVCTRVDDPSKYGVVITDEEGRIRSFQEKPAPGTEESRVANSGIYVMQPEIFDLIPKRFYYDFGSQLFPDLLEHDIAFYGYFHNDYWNDVGSIEEYRRGNFDALEGLVKVKIPGVRIGEDVWIGDRTIIEEDVLMVGPICIGADCHVMSGAKLYGPLIVGDRTVIDSGALLYRGIKWGEGYIGKDVNIVDSIVGYEAEIGEKAAVMRDTVIGNRTIIGEGSVIHPSVRVMPGSVIKKNAMVKNAPEEPPEKK